MLDHWKPPGDGPIVCGQRLSLPLTLGHIFLLAECGSPLLYGGPILPGDVALASVICSQEHKESRKDLGSWWIPLLMRFWGKFSRRDWDAEADLLTSWFEEHAAQPAVVRKGSSGKETAAPWWVNRTANAMTILGMTYDEALSVPLKIVSQLVIASAEAEGRVECWTDRQQSFWDYCAEQDALAEEANSRN